VFGWTPQKFPFNVKTAHTLKIREPHVITGDDFEAATDLESVQPEVRMRILSFRRFGHPALMAAAICFRYET